MTTTWEDVANFMEEEEEIVNWDDKFFICPDCGEPIYCDDYPFLELVEDEDETLYGAVCPVCGFISWGV